MLRVCVCVVGFLVDLTAPYAAADNLIQLLPYGNDIYNSAVNISSLYSYRSSVSSSYAFQWRTNVVRLIWYTSIINSDGSVDPNAAFLDPESVILSYEYAIGTSLTQRENVKKFTYAGLNTSAVVTLT
jgi:hypothetical protein